MKRLLALILLLSILTGCGLLPTEHISITQHADPDSQTGTGDEAEAKDYESLRNVIYSFVRNGKTEGTILINRYDGDVESDLTKATYEVSKLDPLGAYAVDYMTHDCVRLVSYYQVSVHITFRRTKADMDAIRIANSDPHLKLLVQNAVQQSSSRLTLRLSHYAGQDPAAIAAEYIAANPELVMEDPQVSVTLYPEIGSDRIMEIQFQYSHTEAQLEAMRRAVQQSLAAAAEYIRYRETEAEKADLLYTYLTERFSYQQAETVTPLHDALCVGIADPEGLAMAWQLICSRAGMECWLVEGLRAGVPHSWNIIRLGEQYRHVDLTRCMLELDGLTLWADDDMVDYYWNPEGLPVCLPEEEPEPPVSEDGEPVPEENEVPVDAEPSDGESEEQP